MQTILKQTKLADNTHLIKGVNDAGEVTYRLRGVSISLQQYERLLLKPKTFKLVTQPLLLIDIEQNGDELVVEAGDVSAVGFGEVRLMDINRKPIGLDQFKRASTVRLCVEFNLFEDFQTLRLLSMQLIQ